MAQGMDQPEPARFLGMMSATSFEEACRMAIQMREMDEHYNEERNTWWGCRLFDNEADARKSFG